MKTAMLTEDRDYDGKRGRNKSRLAFVTPTAVAAVRIRSIRSLGLDLAAGIDGGERSAMLLDRT